MLFLYIFIVFFLFLSDFCWFLYIRYHFLVIPQDIVFEEWTKSSIIMSQETPAIILSTSTYSQLFVGANGWPFGGFLYYLMAKIASSISPKFWDLGILPRSNHYQIWKVVLICELALNILCSIFPILGTPAI